MQQKTLPARNLNKLFQKLFLDVCPAVRGRESRPLHAHLEAAEGEGSSHHRLVHTPVPGIRDPREKKNSHLSKVLQEDEENQRTSRS